jgi:tripartite-type tricarboxylate transporter receptor subunit TctC
MTFQTSLPMVKSGKIKAIGVASLQRNDLLPDLPTFTEQGVPDEAQFVRWIAQASELPGGDGLGPCEAPRSG